MKRILLYMLNKLGRKTTEVSTGYPQASLRAADFGSLPGLLNKYS